MSNKNMYQTSLVKQKGHQKHSGYRVWEQEDMKTGKAQENKTITLKEWVCV